MHKKGFTINRNTLLHVSTVLGHLQGELSVTVTLGLHFTVEWECAVDCVLRFLNSPRSTKIVFIPLFSYFCLDDLVVADGRSMLALKLCGGWVGDGKVNDLKKAKVSLLLQCINLWKIKFFKILTVVNLITYLHVATITDRLAPFCYSKTPPLNNLLPFDRLALYIEKAFILVVNLRA
jgi:hypothetical protein